MNHKITLLVTHFHQNSHATPLIVAESVANNNLKSNRHCTTTTQHNTVNSRAALGESILHVLELEQLLLLPLPLPLSAAGMWPH